MDWKLLITSFITLVVILDPVGNTPVYLALTRDAELKGRRRLADEAVPAAAAVIFVFAFFGEYILDYLGITVESLSVAGGILLGIVALDMMKGKLNSEDSSLAGANVALVPLGTPLLAGPGAVVAAMLLMGQQDGRSGKALVAAGIAASLIVVWIALRLAELLVRVLRDVGVDLLTRIMGILLAGIAVEFIHQAVVSW
jgi:multiple antibiotic resistance protein